MLLFSFAIIFTFVFRSLLTLVQDYSRVSNKRPGTFINLKISPHRTFLFDTGRLLFFHLFLSMVEKKIKTCRLVEFLLNIFPIFLQSISQAVSEFIENYSKKQCKKVR